MRRAWAVTVLVLLLAGCSTGPDASTPAPGPSATLPATSGPSLPDVPPPALTDTLHLLGPPHMAGQLPEGATEPTRVPLMGDSPGAAHPTWSLPRPESLDLLEFEVVVWVESTGTLVNTAADGCFWNVFLLIDRGDGLHHIHPMCAHEPPTVAPGVRELRLTGTFDIGADLGSRLLLQVSMNTIVPPGSSAVLLAGTPDADSRLTVLGLQLPLDTTTLLL